MKYMLLLSLLFAVGCSQNDANKQSAEFDPASLKEEFQLVKVEDINTVKPLGYESDCTKLVPNSFWEAAKANPASVLDQIDWDQIINLGKEAWQVIKDNQPIMSAKSQSASALPSGVRCWNQLSNWSRPRAETYRVTYKNLYGINVVDMQFTVIYSYGGRFEDTGRYLTNSTIQFSSVDVKWGFVLNADVEIPQVINMGTSKSPVAGMQLTLNWSVDSRPVSLRKMSNSATFFVSGDGQPTQILR